MTTFGQAVEELRSGRRVSRNAWTILDDPDFIEYNAKHSVISAIFNDGFAGKWLPTVADIFADDWMLVP